MVRETRHLWVGNLPDNIREERIREHFKRYGRVQNVKLLGRTDNPSAGVVGSSASGICATVAFMDIKSASKAHNVEHVLDERTLTTEYYEPAAIPSTTGAPSAGSSPAGSGYSGSSSSVNSVPVPSSTQRYHASGGEDSSGATTCPLAASAAAPATWRGTNDSATDFCRRGSNTPAAYGRYQRNNSTAPYSTPPSNVERTTPLHRWYASSERAGATGGESTPSTPGGGTESGRRRLHSGSASSRSDSSSPEPSDTSRASTPATQPSHSVHNSHRGPSHQWSSTASGRPLAICVRNLPTRSTDSSLKDGLYHEYKKHGKVVWVKVVGQNADRYAVVRFKKPSDVEKALEVSQDKLFFGCKISVAPHQSCDDDAESAKPYETDIDEYHPKATRTLFIGNLEKDVTQQQLRDKFKHFGRIIEIDIKKGSGGGAGYAFCQYASISSVVEAIRAMDGEYVGGSRVKLGFGKPVATACVWVDGLTEHTEKQVLSAVSRCGAATSVCVDRAAGAALVHFEQAAAAGAAVRELRRVAAAATAAEPDHPRLCVDYASRECQDAFYEQLEKHGGSAALAGSERLSGELPARYIPSTRHDSIRYDGCGSRSRASSYGRSTSRTPRYNTLDYDPVDYAADRRYRVYDDQGSSPPPEDVPYEDRLQSVVVSPHRARRHRRDSSPEDRKHSKERRRSSGGAIGSRRSRSGSGGRLSHGRRRHRRRRDGSGSRSRAGTPLRDEPDAPPAEPRRPPRDRPPLPMCLPLPKFAAQLLRSAQPQPRPHPPPAPAPDSPPRPPSASSSSAGEAPHSPSLEERIRSLDEKYEKWSGSRALSDAPDRARLRHRLLEIDINEVKPSDVVKSLLAKRSVFDEDSERLEGAVRAPSPTEGGRVRSTGISQRPLRYCFSSQTTPSLLSTSFTSSFELDASDRPADPRLNRQEKTCRIEKLCKINESDYAISRPRPRTPSIDRSVLDSSGRKSPLKSETEVESRSKNSPSTSYDLESKTSVDSDEKDSYKMSSVDKICSSIDANIILNNARGISSKKTQNEDVKCDITKRPCPIDKCVRDVIEMLLKKVEHSQRIESLLDNKVKVNKKLELNNFEDVKNVSDIEKKLENFGKKIEPCNSGEVIDHACKNKGDTENVISLDPMKSGKEKSDFNIVNSKHDEDNNRTNQIISQNIKLDKEHLQFEKLIENEKRIHPVGEKAIEDCRKECEKFRYNKDKVHRDKYENDREKAKNIRVEKSVEKERKSKDDNSDKTPSLEFAKNEKYGEKPNRDKNDHVSDKIRLFDDKPKNDHHRKDKCDKDKRKELETELAINKQKKEEKHKHEKSKKEDLKREVKKESDVKSRKSSRDESSREIFRKDSTDSSTSRASHDSTKFKDHENDVKEDIKSRMKLTDMFVKFEVNKDINLKEVKPECMARVKTETKEEKCTSQPESCPVNNEKSKHDIQEKQRHYSLDSPSESKRKERLNSCSSLPSNIGYKRRISSHDSFDSLNEDVKKTKNEIKVPERRDSKEARSGDRHKTAKFNKGHFAKLIESKTKDDKKNQVKTPDDSFNGKEAKNVSLKPSRKSSKEENEASSGLENNEETHNNLDFLALFELRSSEEDERQKALRKEMKEKKRLQQLQQIQELQMQQDALQQIELMNKLKDDRKQKSDDKKRDTNREKRFSTDRKSRDEKHDTKRRNRKHLQSSDSSDSDEPKKHSIFDIIDDGPTYISMYDKVKARSCKNMQKQEEEKRQEKIKAKFSQLKQSRAKREEKKRSSWDEDSDSENDVRRKLNKSSLEYSSEDGSIVCNNRKRDKLSNDNHDFDDTKSEDYFSTTNDEDHRHKLSRKNSRTRIMSDSSDDDISNKNNYICETSMSDKEPSNQVEDSKTYNEEGIKKSTLLNLFGKSDSDDNKLKCNLDSDTYKSNLIKALCNDLSSESESMTTNRNTEMRKKHKKKQKKYRSYSDDDNKINNSDSGILEQENKYKSSEKQRRHGSKKDKRKDKIRESNDTDESREDRLKSGCEKKSLEELSSECADILSRREGKMEDIFGPLSDDSDKDSVHLPKSDFSRQDFNGSLCSNSFESNTNEVKIKDNYDSRRKKDKKRKLKRWLREDENSLDMDAVSKAIEERLLAETLTDEEIRKNEKFCDIELNNYTKHLDNNIEIQKYLSKQDKLRKENKEKRKKKKRSKDEKQIRKEHETYHMEMYNRSDQDSMDPPILETISIPMLLDIPLPNDDHIDGKRVDSASVSPGLPTLTESSPNTASLQDNENHKESLKDIIYCDDNDYIVQSNDIEIEQIPMPPPYEAIVQDISEVPLPLDPEPVKSDNKIEEIKTFNQEESSLDQTDEEPESEPKNVIDKVDNNASEVIDIVDNNASDVIDIADNNASEVIDIVDLNNDNNDLNAPLNKVEKKSEEKPRAIISQEETEDAVAALLGESFGGKVDTFSAYEEPESIPSRQNDNESTILGTENIPEEDAEEMRQAVQNLNASEMEIKPDTPVSDNDILLIDTDTEEAEESVHDSVEKLPVNIITTCNQNSNTNNIQVKSTDESNAKCAIESNANSDLISSDSPKSKDNDIKIQLARRDSSPTITSTAAPVVTSWTLASNKIIEPHVINIQSSPNNRFKSDNKIPQVTTNILQIKQQPSNQNPQATNAVKPILTPTRVSTPYQVINQIIRPPNSNMQPPTIKIPESHMLYQKAPGIVISPRIGDPRMHSPKSNAQGETVTSPRLTNVALLTTAPQNMNSATVLSPNSMHQRPPGQVTVVRMQQPQLSPIQTLHMPHRARTIVSPRPNQVLVQGTPLHFNRLPVTPVLSPISKQLNASNTQQTKTIAINTSPLIVQQKVITGEIRKSDKNIIDTKNENSKIILSPSNLQHSTNPTVMAQNRLISMQNTVNINSTLHNIGNKLLINKISPNNEKRETQQKTLENINHPPFSSTPIIHMAGVSSTSTSIIQSAIKTVVCSTQEASILTCKDQSSNMTHIVNPQRLTAPVSISNIQNLDNTGHKMTSSVLSLSPIKPITALNKTDSSNTFLNSTKVVDSTPTLIKSNIELRISPKENHLEFGKVSNESSSDNINFLKRNISEISTTPDENLAKCETDFEELLKDNTNEIKVTNDPEKKLEINVGKTTTLITAGVLINDSNCKNMEYNVNKKDTNDICNIDEVVTDEKENVKIIEDKETKENTNQFQEVSSNDTSNSESIKIKENYENDIQSENINNESEKCSQMELKQVSISNENLNKEINSIADSESVIVNADKKEWDVSELNTESVIKKVDTISENSIINSDKNLDIINTEVEQRDISREDNKPCDSFTSGKGEFEELNQFKETSEQFKADRNLNAKRGGRSVRGKRSQKNLEKAQTRQISKPTRGGVTKRGRGRAKVDKNPKSLVNCSASLPGDVYDFHEDSGDETGSNKTESRPRLILTIKSPLSGHAGITATSTLSITQKDQSKNTQEKLNRDEKVEDFVTPLTNTRKSRRLLEKDVNRSSGPEDGSMGEESSVLIRPGRRKQTRQPAGKMTNLNEKPTTGETRKSPRGTKRSRDRSLSDASIESGDGETRKEDSGRDPKIARLEEHGTTVIESTDSQTTVRTSAPSAPPTAPAPPLCAPHNPTPIIKPPKKMISEISAKLAGAFDGGIQKHRVEAEAARDPPCATGEAQANDTRRALDCIGGAMMPVGATEASDARVQSPALPHRPPAAPATGRATPLLYRGGECESAARYRPGAPSLPRGAQLPAPPDASHAPHTPHHHLAGAASRITSVPALSPQGQIALSADVVRSPPPAHQQMSPIAAGDGMYPHFSHQHYQMYQQHFRATQHEARTTPSPFTRTLEAEGSEAPTPPLELRRPPSARVPRPAHSPSPADRHIMYAVGCGRSPPPAHARAAGALPPSPAPGPPHASQVPREADSLQMLLRRYPVMWQGLLALKNDSAAVQMHFVGGNPGVAGDTLARHSELAPPLLRIAQRMRLEPAQLDQVHRKMKLEHEHCILLALPCGRDHMDVLQQSTNLTAGFITYLQRKQAAGIVNIAPPGHHQAMFTVHIFPSCDFANENLNRIAPDLMHRVADIAHLLIVIATV